MHMTTRCRPFRPAGLRACVGIIAAALAAAALSFGPPHALAETGDDEVRLVTDWSRLSGALNPPLPAEAWAPRAARERLRSAAAMAVYPAAAPATVVVRSGPGHGTGLIVDAAGWVLTNEHVVRDAPTDPKTGVQTATVHLGRLGEDGFMAVVPEGLAAPVYKMSRETDLALLKLAALPEGTDSLPVIPLAEAAPKPGSVCVVLGHPAAGMLWTVRPGVVAGVGHWPGDMIDVVMRRLAVAEGESSQIEAVLEAAPQRKVLLSSCGLNPGDSGGPLLNAAGELIGVSFAIPASRGPHGPSLDKFSYHVHLDEVRAFLRDRPEAPLVEAPDPWPAAARGRLADLDGNGTPDTMIFMDDRRGAVAGLLVDLDEDSLAKRGGRPPASFSRDDWNFEFALHVIPVRRAFYDTNNDGRINLILTDRSGNGQVDGALRLDGDTWAADPAARGDLLDAARFEDPGLQARFRKLAPAIAEAASPRDEKLNIMKLD